MSPGRSRATSDVAGKVTRAAAVPSCVTVPKNRNSGSAGPLGSPPNLEPSVYLDSPYMASVASALAVPIHATSASEPAPPQPARWWQFTADKTWLAALAFAAGVALTWFVYEPQSSDATGAEVVHAEGEPSVIRTLSVDDLPRAPGEEAELRLPASGVAGEFMHEDQGRPAAGLLDMQVDPIIGPDHRHCIGSPSGGGGTLGRFAASGDRRRHGTHDCHLHP